MIHGLSPGSQAIQPRFGEASCFSEGLAAAALRADWGFVDKTGARVVEPQFQSADSFSEGPAPVKSGGTWGYVDHRGRLVFGGATTR